MLYLLEALLRSREVAIGAYAAVVVVGAFLLFIAVTLGVALFNPDPKRGAAARSVLWMLLNVLTRKGPRR